MKAATVADRDPPWTPGSLREHLRTIPPERAQAATQLLASGDRLIREADGMHLELRPDVAQQAPHATTAVLTHAHGRISLVVTTEHGSAAVGDRTWHDFEGDSRLLAWSLAYEPLLEQLSDLLGVPLLPVELLPAPSAPGEIWHWAGFRFDRGEDNRCEGLIGLDRAALDAMAGATGWTRGADSASRLGRGDVPLPCRLRLPTQTLPSSTLKALEPGAVLLIGQRVSVVAALRLCVDTGSPDVDMRHAWAASAELGGIIITRSLTEAELRNETMTQDSPDDANAIETADVRDAIPIRVELLLDTLELSLAELERISAGQVLSLAQPVDGARVVLRANGKTFGSGELVSLGELLGVKLTRIGDQRGLQ
jgi:type III secretion system YscQ/HrcQ family protein